MHASSVSAAYRPTVWSPGMFTAEDMKGFHGLDERLSIDNLLLGTKIVHDATLRIAASAA